MKNQYNCPAEMTLSLIGGKWKAILLFNLRKGPKRFGELKRLSPGITSTTLSVQLHNLMDLKLIQQQWIGKERTEGVSYTLTERGESLKPLIRGLVRWGLDHQKDYTLGEFGMKAFNS